MENFPLREVLFGWSIAVVVTTLYPDQPDMLSFTRREDPQPDRWTEAKAWTADVTWRDLLNVHLIHRSADLLIHPSSASRPWLQSDNENAGRRSAGTVDPGLAIRAHRASHPLTCRVDRPGRAALVPG